VILIVPMTLLSAMTGVWLSGGDSNIFVQDRSGDADRPGVEERHPDR